MAKKKNDDNITINEISYSPSDLSENAKAQIVNIQFCDEQMQQLQNEWAIADTARIGYVNALKKELESG